MADLDTRSKRSSSVNVLNPSALALVLPDGTLDAGDRKQSAWAYSASEAVIETAPGEDGGDWFQFIRAW